jgi:hypothetical protein
MRDGRVLNGALVAPRAAADRGHCSVIRDCGLRSVHFDLRWRVPAAAARCVASRASKIWRRRLRQNNTTGKSAKPVQPSAQKYFASVVGQISGVNPRVSPDERGVAHVTNARWDAVDATLA